MPMSYGCPGLYLGRFATLRGVRFINPGHSHVHYQKERGGLMKTIYWSLGIAFCIVFPVVFVFLFLLLFVLAIGAGGN